MLVVSGCVHFVRHVTTTVLETQVFSRIEEFPLWLNCNNLLGNIIDVLFARKKSLFLVNTKPTVHWHDQKPQIQIF